MNFKTKNNIVVSYDSSLKRFCGGNAYRVCQ